MLGWRCSVIEVGNNVSVAVASLQRPPDWIIDTIENHPVKFYDIWEFPEPEIYTEFELMELRENT